MESAIAMTDINVAHCAALGLAIDLFIMDYGELEVKDAVDILNVFTQTNEIVFNNDSYLFEQDNTVDVVEKKLLRLFQELRRTNFFATEILEDDEYVGFQNRFGVVLKARKVGYNNK